MRHRDPGAALRVGTHRLTMLVALMLLGAPGSARANVFVPADPPPRQANCVAAAGDVVVATRRDDRGRQIIEASESGGGWRRLARLPNLLSCPHVVAAPDGTAAILASQHMLLRRPGGRFGAPIAVGRDIVAASLAAAPGGWFAIVGERKIGRLGASDLVATIVAPDGTSSSAVVDRGRSNARSFLSPRIGVDAAGTATVAWTRLESVSGTFVIRTAKGANGMAWAPARSLAVSVEPILNFPRVGQVDVAVAPSGRTVLAWADRNGVRASIDGGQSELLTSEQDAGSPTVAVADDGSAVVAYAAAGGRILAVDRGPDEAWSSAHPLFGAGEPPSRSRDEDGPQEAELASVLAPDGRAVVTWIAQGDVGPRVTVAVGRAGGAWTRATPLSAITRDASQASLSLAVAGDPRLVWIETVRERFVKRLRGARLAPETEAPDRAAPIITTRLPSHAPRTRTGVIAFRIPVRCSEACDARVRILDARTGGEMVGVVRDLPADRDTTFRLTTRGYIALELLASKRARRLRLEVLVTDRAGNVARRARTVAVRVLDRPLLSFQVADDHEFAMFTRAGDRAVARLVNSLIAALAAGEIESFKDLRGRYLRGVRAIARAGQDEVYDSEVGDEIFVALYVPFTRVGYDTEAVMSG